MKVWNGLESYPADRGPVVASIGNYDGVHLGHQAILDTVVAEAARERVPSLLITFDPHPLAVVAPQRKLKRLQTRRQKLEILEQRGLAEVLLIEFDAALASLDGQGFFDTALAPSVRFAAVHVGDNFRFGRGRTGNLALLEQIGERNGFRVAGQAPIAFGGETVSSSAIRRAVEQGDVVKARGMLGRPFALSGTVVRGEGRGRKIDFPTANVDVENEILPGNGVYVTETVVLASRRPSLTNVGVRPTFGGTQTTVESHLLDFDVDLYEERLEVRFLARIRDECQFDTALELGDQIARDRAAAESFFENLQLQSS